MIEFNKKNADADKRKEAVPPVNPAQPHDGAAIRNRKLAAAYKLYAKAYTEFAGKVKGLGADRGVNTELVQWMVNDGILLNRTADFYKELSDAVEVRKR